MFRINSAKIFFFLAVSLFVAKPFLGFSMFSRLHPPAENSIFIKVFSKRKPEYDEDSKFSFSAIQKKLAEPLQQFAIAFSFLSGLLFATVFAAGALITNRFLRGIKLRIAPRADTWLLCGQLII